MESKDSTMASTMCFLLKKANNHFQWWICLWQRCPCCMSTAPINRSNGPPCACLPSNSIQATSCWTFFFQLRNRRFFLTNCLGRAFFHGIPWEVLIPPYSTPPGIATVRYFQKKIMCERVQPRETRFRKSTLWCYEFNGSKVVHTKGTCINCITSNPLASPKSWGIRCYEISLQGHLWAKFHCRSISCDAHPG